MLAEALKYLMDVSTGGTVELPDRKVSSKQYFNMPLPDEPTAKALEISTLTGLVQFAKDADDTFDKGMMAHVVGAGEVYLVSDIFGVKRQRELYIKATTSSFGRYRFGDYLSQADTVIGLQTQFVDTPERAELLLVLGTLKDESLKTSLDNGVSQTGTFSTGVTLGEERKIPSPLILKPFRTFRELDQPSSRFIIRLKQGREGIEVAIIEADGGAWKNEAILKIRDYLTAALPTLTVIA